MARQGTIWLYACAGMYAVGTLYGIVVFAEGELPRILIPVLLVPIAMAIYCFRMARKIAAGGKIPS